MVSRDRSTFEELMNIQRNVNNRVLQEMRQDQEIDLISMVNELTYEDKPTHIEELIVEGQVRGYGEDDVLDTIESMKRQNIIYQPLPGQVQKVK